MAKVIRVLVYEGEPESIRKTIQNSQLQGIETLQMKMVSHIVSVKDCKCFSCGALCNNTAFVCDDCDAKMAAMVKELK